MELNNTQAAEIFAQLGNETRLCIVRILVEAGAAGVSVGDIQKEIVIPASTLSHHLMHLRSAGLIEQRRSGRTLFCAANYDKLQQCLDYLQTNCCIRVKSTAE